MKLPFLSLFLVSSFAAFAGIEATNVKIRQDWPWSNKLVVTYELSGVSAETPGEVVVKAFRNGEEIPMQGAGMTGDVYNLTEDGEKRIEIDPVRTFGKIGGVPNFKVTVTAQAATEKSSEIVYKIFDIPSKTVTDVTRGDLLNGKYGTVETDFGAIGEGYNTTLEDVIIWTGVTNDIAYKTTKLVLRRIPAGDFKGFEPGGSVPATKNMTWTFDYYIGVFELTQKQRSLAGWGSWDKQSPILGDTLPDQHVQNYYMYGIQHPTGATTNLADEIGFFFKLRNKFKVGDICPYDFELPTQVQWMRAMRAGADSYYYDGLAKPYDINSNDQYAALANYKHGGGLVANPDGSVTTNIMEVGSFRPNAYGLYDMLGNVREHVRESGDNGVIDWTVEAGTNVIGAVGGSNHSLTYGGSVAETANTDKTGIGRYTIQVHSASGGSPIAGLRVCMQSMEDGIKLRDYFYKKQQ